MKVSGMSKLLIFGLYLNAALLVGVLVMLIGRSDTTLLSSAYAQQQPQPIAGGGGLFLMPGQLSPSTWGCYVMDVDRQTLMVYQYSPGERMLRFMAGRDFSQDRRIRRYNTEPSPDEIRNLADKEADTGRIVPPPAPVTQ
ncbi:MAG: hypothetical protein KatS3mg104_0084 [Phycisphaerae bacterium]|nr:MAG: hypothetical protein KatS3mg104_0084 [Phycisphaerae bacterium]